MASLKNPQKEIVKTNFGLANITDVHDKEVLCNSKGLRSHNGCAK
jgi:hypothetical protein